MERAEDDSPAAAVKKLRVPMIRVLVGSVFF